MGGGGGLIPDGYLAKKGYHLECHRPLHKGVGGSNWQFFRYVLFE